MSSGRLRIVELADGVAGPACGRLFAALGHDVIKCEAPGGDALRAQLPLNVHGDSYSFVALNAGKRSVVLSADEAAFERLLETADVLIVGLPPGRLLAAGLDAERLRNRWPDLVVVSVTGFGLTGEFADTPADSLLAESYGGLATMIGLPDERPLALGGEQAAHCAALTGFFGAMLALMRRRRGFGGELVDVAMCDVAAYMDWKSDVTLSMTGQAPARSLESGWRLLRAKDGWVGAIFQQEHWPLVVELVGAPALRDARWADEDERLAHGAEWWPVLDSWALSRRAEDIYDDARALGLPFGWVVDVAGLVNSPQLRERGFIDPSRFDVDSPAVGSPVHCTALPWVAGSVPQLGSAEPVWLADRDPFVAVVDGPAAPLAGVTVLDFGAITAGAAVTRLMADYGARVIKVEWVDRPDTFRTWKVSAGAADAAGVLPTSPFFPSNNVGKEDIAIDLKTTRGRALVRELARHCDVLVENYRVGVTERLGIDRASLQAINPDLIYLSLSSQGQSGPESGNSSFGSTLDLLSGLASVSGYGAGEPMWSSSNVNYPDQLVALFGAGLVAYALQRGLRGAHLDVSQREMVSWTLAGEIGAFLGSGVVASATANHRIGRTPHDTYPCLEPGRWLSLSCPIDTSRDVLAGVLGEAEAVGRSLEWWSRNTALVDEWISAWTSGRPRDVAVAELRRAGLAAVPVLDAADRARRTRFTDRQVTSGRDDFPVKGLPMRFDRYPAAVPPGHAPAIGEHTRDVLTQMLGLDLAHLDDLEANRVIYSADA